MIKGVVQYVKSRDNDVMQAVRYQFLQALLAKCVGLMFHKPYIYVSRDLQTRRLLNPLPTTNFRLFQTEFADDFFKFDENGRKLFKQVETLWEKEKLLVRSNFSSSHCVFKRLVSLGKA